MNYASNNPVPLVWKIINPVANARVTTDQIKDLIIIMHYTVAKKTGSKHSQSKLICLHCRNWLVLRCSNTRVGGNAIGTVLTSN